MSKNFNETLGSAIASALEATDEHEEQLDIVYDLVHGEAGFLVSREEVEESLEIVKIYETYKLG